MNPQIIIGLVDKGNNQLGIMGPLADKVQLYGLIKIMEKVADAYYKQQESGGVAPATVGDIPRIGPNGRV